MLDIDLIVSEIDKKIALLEKLRFFNRRDQPPKVICVTVDEFTDFYNLENQTVETPKNVQRRLDEVIEIDCEDREDESSEESLFDEIDIESEDEEIIREAGSDGENEITSRDTNKELESTFQSNESFDHESHSFGKRRRIRNPRYNEDEYLLKNSSRAFTNAIRGKVGKLQKDAVGGESLDANSRDSVKSLGPIVDSHVEEKKIEKQPKVAEKPQKKNITSKILASKYGGPSKQILKIAQKQQIRKQSFQSSLKSRKFLCKICNKTFSKGYSLTRHMFLHSGLRPHVCYICDYKFIQRSDLERHLTVHQEDPQFPCSRCDSKFRTKKSLRNHVILHDDETPFHCPCGKKFRSNKTLRIHHLTRHSDITYECDLCGRFYTLKDYLKSHLKTHRIGGNNFVPRNSRERRVHREEKIKRLRSMLNTQTIKPNKL